MVIKTLFDYCTSFHSFKTDKKKLQVGHVTQNHQATNKPSRHTPVGARPACPSWQGWLLPLSSTELLGDHLPAAVHQIFSWRLHRRATQSRQFNSSRPSRQAALGTESPPEVQLERLERQLCVPALALPSCQACAVCCLLPIPSLSKTNGTHGPLTQGFPASLCSALCPVCSSSQGKGESRWLVGWKEKERAHTVIKVREITALS